MRLLLPAAIGVVLLISLAVVLFTGGNDSAVLDVGECPPADQLPSAQVQTITVSTHTPEAPTPTPPAPPTATPVPASELGRLQAAMEHAVDSYGVGGRYAVAVTDLRTGETASVNGDRAQQAACSVNLFLLLQVALDLQEDRHTLEEVDSLIAATTWSSNASTARDLYEILGDGDALAGVRRVAGLMASLGMRDSVLDHPPLYIHLAGSDATANLLTALEANTALLAVWRGEILDEQWSDYFWGHLARVKPGLNYLLGIVPDAEVSHKNGFFEFEGEFVDNDIGIARWPYAGGEAGFAFSFFSEGVRVKYADIPLGQELVMTAYRHFAALYAP